MSSQQPLVKQLSNSLERFPRLWLLALKIYGFRKFDPARTKYTKTQSAAIENLPSRDLEILFDTQCLQTPTRQRGIGKYTINFIHEMARANPDKQFGAYFTNIANPNDIELAKSLLKTPELPNLHIYVLDAFGSKSKVSATEAISQLATQIAVINPLNLVTMSSFEKATGAIPTPLNLKAQSSAILYDLIPLQYPKVLLASKWQQSFYKWTLDRLKQQELLLAISEETKNSWRKLVGSTPRIEIIYGGPNSTTPTSDGNALSNRAGVLVVGAEQPHKNIPFVIDSYSKLPQDVQLKNPLTIVGIRSEGFRSRLNESARSNGININLPTYLTEAELESFYKSSRILVMPSLMEGLSLPILEAWHNGLVALGSQNTVAEELIEDQNALFSPLMANNLSSKLLTFLTDDNAWTNQQKHIPARRENFTWNKSVESAQQYLTDVSHR